MNFQRDLQVRLQERYRRLYKAGYQLYKNEAAFLVEFIRSTPALRYLVENLERSVPDLDPKSGLPSISAGIPPSGRHPKTAGPRSHGTSCRNGHEPTRAERCSATHFDPSEKSPDAGARTATEAVIEPFIEFLQERIGEASNVLYLLERYVRRVEWFEQERLWAAYQADTAHGEHIYDTDLRRFLFEQGIDYPFSQPKSASGQSDVVANVDGDDPLRLRGQALRWRKLQQVISRQGRATGHQLRP